MAVSTQPSPPEAEYAVLDRQVVREPTTLPSLPHFRAVGGTVMLVEGRTDRRHPANDRSRVLFEAETADAPWPTLLLGGAFLAAGVAVAWLVRKVEPVVPSEWTEPVGLAFAALFGLAGVFILLTAFAGLRRRRASAGMPAWRDDFPWRETVHTDTGMGHTGGAAQRIRAGVLLLLLAGFVALLHLPLFLAPEAIEGEVAVFGVAREVSGSTLWLVAVVLVDLLMLAVAGAMLYSLLQRLRFGRRTLRLLTFPARVGDALEAELVLARPVHATGPARCTLHCIDTGLRPGPEERRDALVGVHSETQELDTAGAAVRRLRVRFALPADAPGTRLRIAPRVYWRLLFRIPTRGPDLLADYLVPVYAPEPSADPAAQPLR